MYFKRLRVTVVILWPPDTMCDINMVAKKSTTFVLDFTTVKSTYNSQKKSCCETSRGYKQT